MGLDEALLLAPKISVFGDATLVDKDEDGGNAGGVLDEGSIVWSGAETGLSRVGSDERNENPLAPGTVEESVGSVDGAALSGEIKLNEDDPVGAGAAVSPDVASFSSIGIVGCRNEKALMLGVVFAPAEGAAIELLFSASGAAAFKNEKPDVDAEGRAASEVVAAAGARAEAGAGAPPKKENALPDVDSKPGRAGVASSFFSVTAPPPLISSPPNMTFANAIELREYQVVDYLYFQSN